MNRFRLATLLRYRKRREDERALALARAEQDRQRSTARLEALRRETAVRRQTLDATLRDGEAGVVVQGLATAVRRAEGGAEEAAVLEAADATRAAEARDALVDSAREHRQVERLEELHRAAAREREEAAVRRHLDDMAAVYFAWRRRGGGARADDGADAGAGRAASPGAEGLTTEERGS